MIKVDACGLSCPEPMILLKRALKDNTEVALLVDNKISVETCSRFAESKGLSLTLTQNGKIYELNIKYE